MTLYVIYSFKKKRAKRDDKESLVAQIAEGFQPGIRFIFQPPRWVGLPKERPGIGLQRVAKHRGITGGIEASLDCWE